MGWGCGSTRRMNCICVVCAALAKSHKPQYGTCRGPLENSSATPTGRIEDRAGHGVLAHWPKTAPASALMSNAAANSARV